ncbi:MAG: ABC transporter permease, partial [Bryobacteraceae bacterium]
AMVWLDNRRLALKEDLMSYPVYEDWKNNQVFAAMTPFTPNGATLTGGDEPEGIDGARVEPEFFSVLGASPRLGRVFTADEIVPGRDAVVILGHSLWMRRFGGDPGVLGKTLEMNNRSLTVVGVMPEGFRFPARKSEFWIPLALPPQAKQSRGGFFLSIVARIKPDVALDAVRAEMNGIGRRLEQQYPNMAGYGVHVVPLHEQLVGNVRPALRLLFAAVLAVLLIGCANVANLLLARAATREREIAVRAALGAGRARLIRQLLAESAILALVAGAFGLLLAVWGTRLIGALGPRDMPGIDDIRVDVPVLAFNLVISLATGIVFGLLPALRTSRADLSESLKEGGRAHTSGPAGRRLRHAIVIAEIAAAVVLVAGAGLLIRSFLTLRALDPGYRPENVLSVRMNLARAAYSDRTRVTAFYQQFLDRLRSISGVESAALIRNFFLSRTPNSGTFTVEGKPPIPEDQRTEATIDAVSPGFFAAMRVPLLRGRDFDARDHFDAPRVAIINDTFARRFWPGEDPVGQRFTFGNPGPNTRWITVAGVAGDMRRQGLEKTARVETFLPHAQNPGPSMTLVVRGPDTARLASLVRGEIHALDRKNILILESAPLVNLIGDSVAQRRFQMLCLALFAGLALALAAVGIYSVMYYTVIQRTQEIGVRMALGAASSDVLRLVLLQGIALSAAGLALGLAAAFAVTRLISSLLYGITPADPLTFAGVPVVLILVALAASYIPARRAARVDPIIALRYE